MIKIVVKTPDLITNTHISSLNRKPKRRITLEIIDLKDEQGEAKGTRVVFGVPVTLTASSA